MDIQLRRLNTPSTAVRKILRSGIARGASGVFISNILGSAVAFGVNILLTRSLGVSEFGRYAYIMVWINLLSSISLLGLDQTIIRFIPEYRSQQKWQAARGLVGFSQRRVLLSSFAISLLLCCTLIIIFREKKIDTYFLETFSIGSILIPILAFMGIQKGILRSFGKAILSVIPNNLLRPSLLALPILVAFFFMNKEFSAMSILVISNLTSFGILVVMEYILRLAYPQDMKKAEEELIRKNQWWEVAKPIWIGAFIMNLNVRISSLILGTLLGTKEVGLYRIAARVSELIAFGLTAINVIIGPLIAGHFSSGDKTGLQKTITVSAFLLLIFSVPCGLCFFFFANEILGLFGKDFLMAETILKVLVVSQIFNSICGPTNLIMIMTNLQKVSLTITIISTFFNISISFIFILAFGLLGAALANLLYMIFWNSVMVIFIKRRLKINPTILSVFSFYRLK